MANSYHKISFTLTDNTKSTPPGKIMEPPLVTVQNVISEAEGHMFDFSTTSLEKIVFIAWFRTCSDGNGFVLNIG